MTPNGFTWYALAAWPVVALLTFAARRTTSSVARTTAWMFVLPTMFLPTRFSIKYEGIPHLDKHRIAFLSIAAALTLFHARSFSEVLRAHRFPRLLFLLLLAGIAETVRTNPDPLVYGPTVLPGLTDHDTYSIALFVILDLYLPFAVAERVFRTARDLRDLLEVLAWSAVIYAPFAVVELVLSPQLHRWVYGYHQHEFIQMMRGTGFRPMIFMNHGLGVAMFAVIGLLASLTLARAQPRLVPSPWFCAGVAGLLLLACKSLAPAIYGAAGAAMLLFLSEKSRGRAVAVVAALVLAYPVLRAQDLLPRAEIIQAFERISPDRADSLRFRFDQEEQLLVRARERPIYGWGSWGRNQIFAPWGQLLSITDGDWIIMLGSLGWVGFGGFFAFLLVPLARFAWRRRLMPASTQLLTSGVALLLVFSAVNLLPNSRPDFLPLVFGGALFGVAGRIRRTQHTAPERTADSGRAPERATRPRRGGRLDPLPGLGPRGHPTLM